MTIATATKNIYDIYICQLAEQRAREREGEREYKRTRERERIV